MTSLNKILITMLFVQAITLTVSIIEQKKRLEILEENAIMCQGYIIERAELNDSIIEYNNGVMEYNMKLQQVN